MITVEFRHSRSVCSRMKKVSWSMVMRIRSKPLSIFGRLSGYSSRDPNWLLVETESVQ